MGANTNSGPAFRRSVVIERFPLLLVFHLAPNEGSGDVETVGTQGQGHIPATLRDISKAASPSSSQSARFAWDPSGPDHHPLSETVREVYGRYRVRG